MSVEVKTTVKGLEELKKLLDIAKKQTIDLEETLNKISETKVEIEFKAGVFSVNENK